MTVLPAPLARGAALCALLPPELAEPLSVLVERVGRALGPFPAAQRTGLEEPDGYDGVGREVHYERLLASEWLLADEAPHEFWRRAAAGEHAFLSLARQSPHGQRCCVVELDAGPSVLGLPRLAMLALLVALERRASRGGAAFRFRMLGANDEFFERLDARSVRAFLDARSAFEPDERDLAGAASADEHWTLGSPRLSSWARRAGHFVALTEHWDRPSVELALHKPGAALRTLTLPMPESSVCVRLLRDPFAASAGDELQETPFQGSFSISARGHRLIEWTESGLVRAHDVPSNADHPAGRARLFQTPAGERLLATTYTDRLIAVTAGSSYLRIYGLPTALGPERQAGRAALTLPSRGVVPEPASGVNECLLLRGSRAFRLIVPHAQGTLELVGPADPHALDQSEPIVASAQAFRSGQLIWLTRAGAELELHAQVPREAQRKLLTVFEGAAVSHAFLACPHNRSDAQEGLVGLCAGSEVRLFTLRGNTVSPRERLIVPAQARCVGVELPVSDEQPRLVSLEADQKTFVSIGRSGATMLLKSPEPVEEVRICPASFLLAFTTARSLSLFDLQKRRPLTTLSRQKACP